MITTTTTGFPQDQGKDPRCPHCGKPVLGIFVQGVEGRYHPACTEPDPSAYPKPMPVYPQCPHPWVNPFHGPYVTWWWCTTNG